MSKLYAESILIGSQWQSDKTICVSSEGIITDIQSGRASDSVAVGGTMIPGMVNCHSHAFQRAFAGFSEYRSRTDSGEYYQDSFWSWRDIMYRFVAKMSPEDSFHVARFLYLEMLKAGYTSVAEFHYLHHQADGKHYDDPAEMSHQIINAAGDSGIRLTHLPVLYSYAGFGQIKPSKAQGRFIHATDDYLALIDKLDLDYRGKSSFSLGIAPHSLRAVDNAQLSEIIPHIRNIDSNAAIHIHIAEQVQEVNDSLAFYGQRPVEWLMDNYQLDQNWCLVHATHLTEGEVKGIATSDATVGICPLTEANLGDGIFPTREYLSQGGNFGIGSDSHIGINVAEELRLLEYAQRLTERQRAVLVDEECSSVGQYLYSKACRDGAAAINQNVGEISIGKRADFLVLDNQHPSLLSRQEERLLDSAIFAANSLPVSDVYVAGKKVIEQGSHRLDNEVYQNYKRVLANLV